MARRSKSGQEPPPPEFKANPFADLRMKLSAATPATPPPPPPKPAPAPPARLDAEDQRLLEAFKDGGAGACRERVPAVRVELCPRRGGQSVTRVQGLRGMAVLEQMQMADDVRRSLGQGLRARFQGEVLEVDGDQRQRLAAWLQSRGYACG